MLNKYMLDISLTGLLAVLFTMMVLCHKMTFLAILRLQFSHVKVDFRELEIEVTLIVCEL